MNREIIYIANARLPTEKAHGVQIMNMCAAFASLGQNVELVVPRRLNPIKTDIFSYYHQPSTFRIKKLPCIDLVSIAPWLGSMAYYKEAVSFAWFVGRYIRRAPEGAAVYTRDLITLLFVSKQRLCIYEAHSLPQKIGWLFKKLLLKVDRLVVITNGLKEDFIALGFPAEHIIVAPDAVDPKLFAIDMPLIDCRKKLNLPLDRDVVVYTGHLYDWKGVGTILEAAQNLPEQLFVLVGGTKVDQADFAKKVLATGSANVLTLGHRAQTDVPYYLQAADVLLLPNSGRAKISSRYTSPLKLFEYMASRRPMIASDLPSLREILDETTATFFTPDDAGSLASAIQTVLGNSATAKEKAERAYRSVIANYTWERRAQTILNYVWH